ncbi:hypothetical protein Glove_441g99 [Diversispora epigaea]|uniref:Uncharacterized protein n=1 Tax=Diversispora epigaea TaxID=1348612 RepID=A0A397GWN5_9GLOM|nr:hypothetical protein Glove_441g99 [Diversispora epigaea]
MVKKEPSVKVSVAKRNIDEFYDFASSQKKSKCKECKAKYSFIESDELEIRNFASSDTNSDTSCSSNSGESIDSLLRRSDDIHVYKTVAMKKHPKRKLHKK